MPKAARADSVRRVPRRARTPVAHVATLVGLVLLVLHVGSAAADLKLLPPGEAFRLAARPRDTNTVEANLPQPEG
jgi:hypothetical protein